MKKKSLLANSGVVILAQIWGMLLTLSITPYVYHSLGPEGYGLFSLVLILANYLSIVDLGFGWGIIKFVAEYAASGDFRKMEGVIRVSVWMSVVLGVLLAAGLVCLAPWLAHSVFNVPRAKAGILTGGIALAACAAIVILLSNVLAGVLKGLQRFDLAVGLRAVFTTFRMVGYVLLLYAGCGLLSLWILTISGMLACAVAYVLCIKRLLPEVSLQPGFDRSSFKTIFSFSVFGFGTRLLTMPYFYLDKLFISSLLPVAALSHYVVPFNLAQKIGGVGSVTVGILFPSASERAHDRRGLRALYRRVVPVAYSLILPMILVAVTVGPYFLRYWIDDEFGAIARLPLILVTIGTGALVLGSIDATFIEGVGRPRIRTTIYAVLAVVSLPLCYFLTRQFGINGTAATVCLAFSAGGLLDVLCHQIMVAKSWWYLRRIIPGALAVIVLGLPVGWSVGFFVSGLWSTVGAGILVYLLLAVAALRIFHTAEQFRAHLARASGVAIRFARRTRLLADRPCGS